MTIIELNKICAQVKSGKWHHFLTWYVNEDGKVIQDTLTASKREYLSDDTYADKRTYKTKEFESVESLYTYLLVKLDLKPSEFEIDLYDNDGTLQFTYNADCLIVGL